MPKLKKIYEYIDSLYPIYGDNANIKNYVEYAIYQYRWGEQKPYLYFVNLVSKTALYQYNFMSDMHIVSIKDNCKDIIAAYANSFDTYEDKEILLELPKITYLKHIWHPYTKQSLNAIRDILLYSIYLTYNKL